MWHTVCHRVSVIHMQSSVTHCNSYSRLSHSNEGEILPNASSDMSYIIVPRSVMGQDPAPNFQYGLMQSRSHHEERLFFIKQGTCGAVPQATQSSEQLQSAQASCLCSINNLRWLASLGVAVWVSSWCSSFLPHHKNMQIRLNS